jgi:hypothetical protein
MSCHFHGRLSFAGKFSGGLANNDEAVMGVIHITLPAISGHAENKPRHGSACLPVFSLRLSPTRTSRNQKEFISHESGTPTEMKSFFRGSSISVGESFALFAKISLVTDYARFSDKLKT